MRSRTHIGAVPAARSRLAARDSSMTAIACSRCATARGPASSPARPRLGRAFPDGCRYHDDDGAHAGGSTPDRAQRTGDDSLTNLTSKKPTPSDNRFQTVPPEVRATLAANIGKGAIKIDSEALYVQLGRFVQGMPDLVAELPYPKSTYEWLGRVEALIDASGETADLTEFRLYSGWLSNPTMQWSSAQEVTRIIYRALAKAELIAPAAVKGSFIPAGNSFDAMGAIGKILNEAIQEAFIIDPYLDEKVLTDFAALLPELRQLRLLADQQSVKPTLRPAATRWIAQYGAKRPLEAKLAPAKTLHRQHDYMGAYTIAQRFRGSSTCIDRQG